MAQQPKGKQKDRTEASRKQGPKAPPKTGRELSEEELKQVAGGIVIEGGIRKAGE
jgi:bacteriocin-like protein